MPAIASRVILFVDEIGRMTDFYTNVIGLVVKSNSDGFVVLYAGAIELALHQLPELYADPEGAGAAREDSYFKLVFHSDDVAGERESLTARGVRMREIVRYDGIEFCDGLDPEGNVIQISSR